MIVVQTRLRLGEGRWERNIESSFLVEDSAGRLPGDRRSKASQISPARVQAKACFAEALAIAKEQQAKSWQLRANISMDRLEAQRGKRTHTQLAETYSFFTEGHETFTRFTSKTRKSAICL